MQIPVGSVYPYRELRSIHSFPKVLATIHKKVMEGNFNLANYQMWCLSGPVQVLAGHFRRLAGHFPQMMTNSSNHLEVWLGQHGLHIASSSALASSWSSYRMTQYNSLCVVCMEGVTTDGSEMQELLLHPAILTNWIAISWSLHHANLVPAISISTKFIITLPKPINNTQKWQSTNW